MKPPARPTLSLGGRGLVDPATDRRLDLADYDLLLPCRRFRIEHKVAVLGRVSLTAEFLLRLVKSLDGISEVDAAAFFGFDRREAAYVLGEGVGQGFVERRDGRLWLTTAGHALFRDGSAQPEIFDVESRVDTVGFDLISLAPQRWGYLDPFDARLPEMRMLNDEPASAAGRRVPAAFRRFYAQIPGRRDVAGARRSLYSIGQVIPGDRFATPVRITFAGTGLKPAIADGDLAGWLPEHEQNERPEVMEAAAAFKEALLTTRRPDDADAYRLLSDLAPEFLSDFVRGDEMTVERYYRQAYERTGEPRADRPTVPVLGSLMLRPNLGRLVEVLAYGLKVGAKSRHLLWVAPQVPYWGAVRTLPELLKQLIAKLTEQAPELEQRPASVCLTTGQNGRHLDAAFDYVIRRDSPAFPHAFEALLIPGAVAAAVVHAPIGSQSGLPVPLGILSFDPRVIARLTALIGQPLLRAAPADLQSTLASELAEVQPAS